MSRDERYDLLHELSDDELNMYERLARDSEVHLLPEMGADDVLFDEQFERRARELNRPTARVRSVVQKVALVDAPQGEWSGPAAAYYGQNQPFAPTADNRQTIIKLPQRGDPKRWTLMLGLEYPDDELPGPSGGFEITAEIIMGAGGATQTVYVDWIQGQVVPCSGNAIEVNAIYNNLNPVPPSLRVIATLVHGACSNRPTLTISNPQDVTGPGAIGTAVRIPPFARRVWMVTDYGALQNLATIGAQPNPSLTSLSNTGMVFGATVTGASAAFNVPVTHFLNGGGPIDIFGDFFKYIFFRNDTTLPLRPVFVFELGL